MNKPCIYRTPWKDRQGATSWACSTLSDSIFGAGWSVTEAYEDWLGKNCG